MPDIQEGSSISDKELFNADLTPLKGTWWKYALGFAVIQILLWGLLIYRRNPDIDPMLVLRVSAPIYASFIVAAAAPFAFGRLGLSKMMWWTFGGVLLGMGAYYLLSLYEPTSRINLLPFTAYLQLTTAGFLIGSVWQLGAYVYRKLKE